MQFIRVQKVIHGEAVGALKLRLDTNPGIFADEIPWTEVLSQSGTTTDLPVSNRSVGMHKPDIRLIPGTVFRRLIAKGCRTCRDPATATSKRTGTPRVPNVLVVHMDDPPRRLGDVEGATYGHVMKSCSPSCFPTTVMLEKPGKKSQEFLKNEAVTAWQGQGDAVVAAKMRSTMDPWGRKAMANAPSTSKLLACHGNTTEAVAVVREEPSEMMAGFLPGALAP